MVVNLRCTERWSPSRQGKMSLNSIFQISITDHYFVTASVKCFPPHLHYPFSVGLHCPHFEEKSCGFFLLKGSIEYHESVPSTLNYTGKKI